MPSREQRALMRFRFATLPRFSEGAILSSFSWSENRQAEPVPQAHERRRVVRRNGHAAHGHGPASATSIGPAIPRRHELCGGLARGRRGELPEERSRAERRGEAPVMRRGAQRPHMHVEFVGQDLKRHSIMRWPLRLQRPRLADDSLRRGPSAGIPGAERFDGDTKSRRALRLGQAEPRPDLSQRRCGARPSVTTMPLVRRRLKANGWR